MTVNKYALIIKKYIIISVIIYKIYWVCLSGLDINSIVGGDSLGSQSDVGRRAIYLMENAIKPLQDAFTGIEKVNYFNKIISNNTPVTTYIALCMFNVNVSH